MTSTTSTLKKMIIIIEAVFNYKTLRSMGRTGTKLSNFCLNRLTATIRVRSPPIHHQYPKDSPNKQTSNSIKTDQKKDVSDNGGEKNSSDGLKPGLVKGRKIMIVVDSSMEAKGALQWALTHTVQSQDILVLLYVLTNSSIKQDEEEANGNKKMCPKIYELLSSVKNLCHVKRPEVQVEVVVVEGKEKGSIIVGEAKKQEVSLLVLGQKKRSMTWRLVMMWAGNRILGGGVVEYCIQNANCMTIAVRRKSKKLGGYLITTKRHKDFWLLA